MSTGVEDNKIVLNKYSSVIISFFFILLIIYLVSVEYKQHDCIDAKISEHTKHVLSPTSTDNPEIAIDKLYEMVRSTYTIVRWRQAILAGLIVCIPLVYFIQHRLPYWYEWIAITVFVAFIYYFVNSWIYCHFHYPNCQQIERNLLLLRDKITPTKIDKSLTPKIVEKKKKIKKSKNLE